MQVKKAGESVFAKKNSLEAMTEKFVKAGEDRKAYDKRSPAEQELVNQRSSDIKKSYERENRLTEQVLIRTTKKISAKLDEIYKADRIKRLTTGKEELSKNKFLNSFLEKILEGRDD